jgi:DNA-binding XRE family transcriptional regulator
MNAITYANIVTRLVKLREKHHIGTKDMANYVGVSRQSIYNFESGSRQSYKILLSYLTHPAFSMEELKVIYDLMGG